MKTEDGRRKTEDGRRKTEDRRWKTEDGRPESGVESSPGGCGGGLRKIASHALRGRNDSGNNMAPLLGGARGWVNDVITM
jgi:hypothetical protein